MDQKVSNPRVGVNLHHCGRCSPIYAAAIVKENPKSDESQFSVLRHTTKVNAKLIRVRTSDVAHTNWLCDVETSTHSSFAKELRLLVDRVIRWASRNSAVSTKTLRTRSLDRVNVFFDTLSLNPTRDGKICELFSVSLPTILEQKGVYLV